MSPQLPQEILIEILLRLPVKSLLRFRSVSRSWNSLITSQTFIALHLSRSIKAHDPSIILNCYDPSCHCKLFTVYRDNTEALTEVEELAFLTMTHGCFYISACNGLVCLSNLSINGTNIILWNPSIKICFQIPIPRFINSIDNNDWSNYCVAGLGFDCRTNKYKVVRLIYASTGHMIPLEVEVFVLGTNKWRRVSTHVPFTVDQNAAQAYLHGAIHWIGCRLNQSKVIVVFDVHEEVFRDIEIPSNIVDPNSCTLLVTIYEKSLCLLERQDRVDPRICFIWVMKRYGVKESWIKQFSINMQVQGGLKRVMAFWKHDKILCENACQELVSYDPKSGMVEQVVVRRKRNEILAPNGYEESAFCHWSVGSYDLFDFYGYHDVCYWSVGSYNQFDLYGYHDAIPYMECLALLGMNGIE